MVGNPGTVSTENIDEVILRLLKIKSGTEIDYQTYFNAIKKRLAAHRMVGAEIPAEEDQLLREELKRVGKLKDKGRFKVKTKKAKISTEQTNTQEESSKTGAIIKAPPGGKITPDKLRPPQVEPVNVKDITEKTAAISKGSGPLDNINKKLDSIISTLLNVDKENKKEKERQRRESESKKRSEREKGLESKTFDGLKKAVSAITKPFQSIWDRIFNFIFYTLLGRVMIKLFDWFADPNNKDKIQSLIRFVKDWWPALLGSYILFGTSFGRLVRGLTGMVGRFIFQIGKVAIPKLLRFIRSPLGAGALLFTAGATVPAMFPGTVNEQERKTEKAPGTNAEKITALEKQKANLNPFEKLQGKGSEIDEQIEFLKTGKTKSYGFSGGGFANFGKMFGGAAMGAGLGSMFGPMGTLLGAGLGGAAGSGMFNGFVSGPKGKDKVPAMLTDGEFVMSTGAVQKYGVETLEAMNAAGGGTNQPKVVGGKTYAAEGGQIRRRYPRDTGEKRQSQNTTIENIENIKKFIKHKIGFDVDKPETWGSSFSSAFSGKSSASSSSRPSSGFDFSGAQNQLNVLTKQAQQSLSAAANPRSYQGLLNAGQPLVNRAQQSLSAAANPRSYQGLLNAITQKIPSKEQAFGALQNLSQRGKNYASGLNPLTVIGKTISDISSKPYFGETSAIERERKLGLMNSGARPLTKETEERLARNDKWIQSLYDPKKDTGIVGEIKKKFQDIQDKGAIPDLLAPLKEEGTEKFIERLSGGKIKNFGASVQGVQMSLKALAGPLGRMFRVDDRGSLGRYLRPAMEEAQKQGHSKVGAKVLGQELYNTLLPNKIANFALGQTSFMVDQSGRAKTGVVGTSAEETWDFNQTAERNFAQSREALNAVGNILQGRSGYIGEGKNKKELSGFTGVLKGLGETGFKGMSGVFRMLQNTSYGNLRPMGTNIDLGGGFKPTDAKGKVLSNAQIKAQRQKQITEQYGQGVTLYDKPRENPYRRTQKALEAKRPWWDKMGWFGGGSRVAQNQRKKAQISRSTKLKSSVKPPPKPTPKKGGTTYRGGQRGGGASPSTQKAPSPSPRHKAGTKTTEKTTGTKR